MREGRRVGDFTTSIHKVNLPASPLVQLARASSLRVKLQ